MTKGVDLIMSKKEIIEEIIILITMLAQDNEENKTPPPSESPPIELLTVKECTELIQGLTEHHLRRLLAEGKIPYISTGEGKRSKKLINKADLINYFSNPNNF